MRSVLTLLLLAVLTAFPSLPCTAFCASARGVTLAGNNEDYNNPLTKLWFVPSDSKSYGRLYVGFEDLYPQGGMNEKGLFFDGFATERVPATSSAGKPHYGPKLADKAMAECATVDCVIKLFEHYHRGFLEPAVLMFADASGGAVAIEPDAIIRKSGPFFIQTNFHQSTANLADPPCRRYKIARAMLQKAGSEVSVDLFRRILAATHAEGPYPTLYSNIYDLNRRVMHLYHFHNYEHAVTIDLAAELRKGAHTLDIPSLFPKSHAAESFVESRAKPATRAR